MRTLLVGARFLALAVSSFGMMYEAPRSFSINDQSQCQVPVKIMSAWMRSGCRPSTQRAGPNFERGADSPVRRLS